MNRSQLYRFLLLILTLFGHAAKGQNITLKNIIKDKNTCAALNDSIENEYDHNVWIKYNGKLKSIATQNLKSNDLNAIDRKEFRRFLAISLLNDGAFYNYTDKYVEAIESYNKSLRITITDKNYGLSASNYQNIATVHDFLGNLDSTYTYLQKALRFAQKSDDELNIAYVLTDLGYTYKNLGSYKKAIQNNLRALKLFKKLKDTNGEERTYFAIARIFDDQREYTKSENYYLKGLQIADKSGDYVRQCLILNGLANVQLMKKDYSKLTTFCNKSLAIAKKNKLTFSVGMSYRILGEGFIAQNELEKAREYLRKASEIFTSLGNENHNSQALLLLAKSYLNTQDHNTAKPILLKAYAQAKQSNFPLVVRESADLLTRLYQKAKDYEKAFGYQQEARMVSDSLFRDENKNAALKAEFAFQNELKERELESIAQQKQIIELRSERKNALIYSILVGVLFMGLLVYFGFERYKKARENELLSTQITAAEERLKIEEQAKESELKALKSQMNPHFMFNALNSIQEQFMYGDKTLANEQIGNFAYFTRQILSVSGKKKILLSTEIDLLTKYLDLEKMRFSDDFDYEISCGENIDEDYHQIPPMLIQPFAENSLKHGLLHKKGNKHLSIRFDLDEAEENLICVVQDNGVGRAKSEELKRNKATPHESFSTAATNQRLNLLRLSSSTKDFIIYEDLTNSNKSEGTRVTVTIPFV